MDRTGSAGIEPRASPPGEASGRGPGPANESAARPADDPPGPAGADPADPGRAEPADPGDPGDPGRAEPGDPADPGRAEPGEPPEPGRADPGGPGRTGPGSAARAGTPPHPPRGRPWLSAVLAMSVALLGLAASAFSVISLERQQRQHVEQSLERQAELVKQSVVSEAHRYVETLGGLAAAVNAQTELTAQDFETITSTMTRGRLLGVAGVSLVVPVAPDRLARVQQFWRERGSAGLTLRPVETGRREHLFSVLVRSLEPGGVILGQDASESNEAIWALERASLTGQIAASETYVLLRDWLLPSDERQLSFVIAAPVRVHGDPGTNEGWLIMALRGQDFLSRTLREVSQGVVEVVLIDTAGPGPGTPVASWPEKNVARVADRRKKTIDIPVAQRVWQLEVYATKKLVSSEVSQLPLLAGAGGFTITLLLAWLVLVLASSRERAVDAVYRATAALEADIARREEVERRLRRSEAELRGFAGVAAHDLKAPLASASAYLEVLAEEGSLDDNARSDVARARDGMRRMGRLIGDLLAYATADQADLRSVPVDLMDLVTDIVRDRAPLAGSHGQRGDPYQGPLVEIGPLPTVTGDPIMLRQLLDNLIGNAIKYVPAGSRAQVTVRAHPSADGRWQVEVADRGIGVPTDQRATVFDAFRRAKGAERYPGTGLGLAICHRIVSRHAGTIGVSDNPGGGSVFWFVLPGAG